MQQSAAKHAERVIGALSGFDRPVFQGTLRMLAYCGGLVMAAINLTRDACHGECNYTISPAIEAGQGKI